MTFRFVTSGNAVESSMPALKCPGSLSTQLLSPVERRAVMRHQQRQPDHSTRNSLIEHIPDRGEVAGTLGHLLPVNEKHAVVDPVAIQGSPVMSALALADLTVMVREAQICSAAMN